MEVSLVSREISRKGMNVLGNALDTLNVLRIVLNTLNVPRGLRI